jgi:hypothetical protein
MGRCEWDERQVEWRIDCRKSVRDGEKKQWRGKACTREDGVVRRE